MEVGRLQLQLWKDTGKPRFRIGFFRFKNSYFWALKIMSYWTIWIAWLRNPSEVKT